MYGYGSHNVPVGTWSDDTSMTLATMNSIYNKKELLKYISNYEEILLTK